MDEPVTFTATTIAMYVICPALAILFALGAYMLWRRKKKKAEVTNG